MAVSDLPSVTVVRPARTDDIPALVALNEGLSAEDAGTRDPFANPNGFDRYEYYTELIADGERNVAWAAEIGGAAVGYLVGRLHDANDYRPVSTGVLESFFVHPDRRNAGVGSTLVEAFLQWARDAEAGRVVVTAYAENAGAIRFYRRFGWRPRDVTFDMAI